MILSYRTHSRLAHTANGLCDYLISDTSQQLLQPPLDKVHNTGELSLNNINYMTINS